MHWKDSCWSWSSNTLATLCEELTHWKRAWCWERLSVGGERADREDGLVEYITDSTDVSLSKLQEISEGQGRKPGALQAMRLWRVRHDLETKQQKHVMICLPVLCLICAISSFWLLWIVLLWTFVYIYLFEYRFSAHFGIFEEWHFEEHPTAFQSRWIALHSHQ